MNWDEKLKKLQNRFNELNELLSSGSISSEEIQKYSKEHSDISPLVAMAKQYFDCIDNIEESKEMMEDSDPEISKMAKDEYYESKKRLPEIEYELKILMLPKDKDNDRNIILEIRSGAGGDEASIFAGDVLNMYTRFSELSGWKTEILDESPNEIGGYNFVSMKISGKNVFERMKYESGGHRVQRIPDTESNGRVHTSAATVAILPEATEVDIKIDPSDLRVDTYRASGAGGQHVNTTDSAVRITHVPTGVVAQCQSQRSQHKNKEQAMKMLISNIYNMQKEKEMEKISSMRQELVGSGDRSQRIRTYNFPQNRISDHRINLTLYKLDKVIMGELDEIIDKLISEEQLQMLTSFESE